MEGTARAEWLWEEVQGVLQAAVMREGEALCQGDLRAIEARLQALLRRVGGALLGGVARLRLADLAGERPVCPGCGGAVRLVGRRPRTLVGLVGEVTVERPYYHCAACQTGMAPLDAAWGLGSGSLTPELARVVCRDAIEAPFAQAAELVAEHLGVQLDAETVRGVSEALGALVETDQQDPTCWVPVADAAVPALIALEVDGVMVHEVDAWHELKVGRVAPLGPGVVEDPQRGEAHLALGPSTYCVGREEAAVFWPRLMREVVRAGWGRGVRVVVLIADGADWIWKQARCQLRRDGVVLVEILDFYHASKHLADVANAVFGAQSLRARDWLAQQCHTLRHQGPRPVRRALATLRPPTTAAADLVRTTAAYFRTHAQRMNYPAFRARQWPIGSGAIEASAKNLIQARQVQAGMRWTTPGAQCLASLRALHRSGRWQTFWQSRPQARLRLLPGGRSAATVAGSTPDAERPPLAAVAAPAPAEPPSPPPLAVPPPVPVPPTAGAQRIQTAGKAWWQHRRWADRPFCPRRSA